MHNHRTTQQLLIGLTLALIGAGCEATDPVGSNAVPDDYESRSLAEAAAETASTGKPAWLVRTVGGQPGQPPRDRINAVAVAGDHLYFTGDWEGIYRTAKSGGAVEVVESGPENLFQNVASSGDDVFWVNTRFDDRDYPFLRVQQQTAPDTRVKTVLPERQLSTLDSRQSVQFQASRAGVFMNAGPNGAGSRQAILRVRDGQSTSVLPLQDVFESPAWAVDDSHLYFVPRGTGSSPRNLATSQLHRVSIEGGAPEELTTLPVADAVVGAVDDTHVYLTTQTSVWQVEKQTRTAVELVREPSGLSRLLKVDRQNAYFVAKTSGRPGLVHAVPRAGGAPVPLTPGADGRYFRQMEQDEGYLYLLADAELLIVAKTPPVQARRP